MLPPKFRRGLSGLLLVACASACAIGCGRPETAADRHFAELDEAVRRMQADHDKVDQRLSNIEIAMADDKKERDTAKRAAGADKPAAPPRVVQLGGAAEDSEDANSDGGRPEIRLSGTPGVPGSTRAVRGKTAGRRDDADLGGLRADGPRSSALDPDAKKAYESALALVQNKQFDRGLEGLTAFLVRWPDHPFAENATYWRGEAYYGQGEYLRAAEQFEAVLARFGSGSKGPDALLKLGLCHDRLGSPQRAREYWDRLKSEYPKSDAARRIPSAARDTSPKGPKESR